MDARLDTTACPARLTLAGEMTIYAAAELKPRLLGPIESCAEIEVDLSGVAEIDTAGLQLLILAKRQAISAGKSLRLAGHSRPVLELIELYNLAAFFGDPMVISAREAGSRRNGGEL